MMRITRNSTSPRIRVLGIDPSLTLTGWAFRDGATVVSGRIPTDDLRGPWRLSYIRRELEKVIGQCQPTYAAYEDYAMGFGGGKRNPGRVFHIGELGGVLKTMLWERGIAVINVPPTSLKKAIVGYGGSKKKPVEKKHMILAIADLGYGVRQADEADATGLLLFGEWKTVPSTIPKNALHSMRLALTGQSELTRGKLQSIANNSGA